MTCLAVEATTAQRCSQGSAIRMPLNSPAFAATVGPHSAPFGGAIATVFWVPDVHRLRSLAEVPCGERKLTL
jgi:hypothetical protein